MKKHILLLLILALAIFSLSALNKPHPVFFQIENSDGSTPVDGSIDFEAYINSSDTITENSDDCYYDSSLNNGSIKVNVGNLNSDWEINDLLNIEIISTSGETATSSLYLTGDGFDVDAGVITLQPPVSDPNPATLVAPTDGATDLDPNVVIEWSPDTPPQPDGYHIYVGTDGGGTTTPVNLIDSLNTASTYYTLNDLDYNTTYYWQIVPYTNERNQNHTRTKRKTIESRGDAADCPIWSFTIMEEPTLEPAVVIYPDSGSVDILTDIQLDWEAGSGAEPDGYTVYMGTDGGGTETPTNLISGINTTNSYYDAPELQTETTYYWRIVPYLNSIGGRRILKRDARLEASDCPIWSFTTISEPDPLIINEIMYNTSGYDDEWIEIHNPNAQNMLLSTEWSIVIDDETFYLSGYEIPAQGYFTIGVGSDGDGSFNNDNPFTPDATTIATPGTIADVLLTNNLGNTSSTIEIRYSSILVDSVSYQDSAPFPSQPDGGGPSLELIDPAYDNTLGENWQASYIDGGTPGAENSELVEIEVSNISELRAGDTDGTIYHLTGEAILTFQQDFRNQKYIQDASAAVLIDDNSGIITTEYNQYDGITGLKGTLSEYGNMLQFIPTEDPGAPTSSSNVISPETISMTDFVNNFDDYEAELVKFENVSFLTSGTFSVGQEYDLTDETRTTINFRTSFYDADYIGTTIPTDQLNLVGLCHSRTSGNYIASRNLDDFDTIEFNAPTALTASTGDGFVELSWTAPATRSLDHYKIYRNSTEIDTTSNTEYTDIDVTNGGTYSYQVTAVYLDPAGESDPSNLVEITVPTFPAPTAISAAISDGSVELSWSLETRNLDYFEIYRNSILLDSTSNYLYTDNTVTNGNSYDYYLKAIYENPAGESDASDTISVDIPYYAPPTNLTAEAGDGFVDLDWTAPADGEISNYIIYRDSSEIATPVTSSFTDSNVENGQEYSYFVTAIYSNPVNESNPSEEIAVQIPVFAAPENLTAEITPTSIILDWTAPTSRSLASYNVFRNGSLLTNVSESDYEDTDVVLGNLYSYYVIAVYESPAGESEPSDTISVEMPEFNAPQNLSYSTGDGFIQLNWEAPASRETLTGYNIYKDDTLLTNTALLSYTDNDVSNGQTYQYYLTAVYADPAFESEPTDTITVTVPTFGTPTNLTAEIGDTYVDLAWYAPLDRELSGYNIYKNDSFLTFVSETEYIDTAVNNGQAYSYYVTAVYVDPDSESEPTDTLTVQIPYFEGPTALTGTAGDGFADLSWTAPSEGVISHYKVYRDSVFISNSSTTEYQDSGLVNGSTYSYFVTAVYASPENESYASNSIDIEIPVFPEPTDLTAAAGNGWVNLNWNSPREVDLTGYKIYRNNQFYLEVDSTGYLDEAVSENTQYSYSVAAIYENPEGESILTDSVDVEVPFYTAPTGLTAEAGDGFVDLSWTEPTTGGEVSNYIIYRDNSQIATPTTTSYTDSEVENGEMYTYYVTALYSDPENESNPSDEVDVEVPSFAAPANLSGEIGNGYITLSWTAPQREVSLYRIFRNDIYLSETTALTFTDEDLAEYTDYSYYITAVYENPAGESDPSEVLDLFMPYFEAPANLTVEAGDGFVDLSWDAPENGQADSYNVYRNDTFLYESTLVQYTDNNVENGEEYTYYVTANYSGPANESDPSNSVNVTVPTFPAPGNLQAIIEENSVVLNWDAPESRILVNYNIYRDLELIGTSEASTYQDMDVEDNTWYSYSVTAVYQDPAGESLPSDSLEVYIQFLDGNDDPSTAVFLEAPSFTDSLEINPDGDVDWYMMSLEQGEMWKIFTERIGDSEIDNEAWLYGPHNQDGSDVNPANFIASDDDSHGDFQPELEFTVPQTGYYFLRIAYYADDPSRRASTGEYSLTIQDNTPQFGTISGTVWDDESLEPIEDALITIGDSTTTTDENGDYEQTVLTGLYTVSCQAEGYFTMTENDVNITEGETTVVDFPLLPNPAYDDNDSPETATQINIPLDGEEYSIGYEGDEDWYRFHIDSASEWRIFTERINDSLIDNKAWLYGPAAENGSDIDLENPIAVDDDDNGNHQPLIEFEFTESGYYFLRLAYWNNSPARERDTTGDYSLTIEDMTTPTGMLEGNLTTIFETTPVNMVYLTIGDAEYELSGTSFFLELEVGTYDMTANSADYETLSFSDIEIVENETTTLDLVFRPAEITPPLVLESDTSNEDEILLEWEPADESEFQISYNNQTMFSGLLQSFDYAYGTVFDLRLYQDYNLSSIDFWHNSFGLSGPFSYNLHIINWETLETIQTINDLSTTVIDDWETGVELGDISTADSIGIFIEPLSNTAGNAYPNLAIDNSSDHNNSFIVDLDSVADFQIADGDFLINLWLTDSTDIVRFNRRPEFSDREFIGYNIYQNNVLIEEEISGTTYTLTDLEEGEYDFFVTSVYNTYESLPSNTIYEEIIVFEYAESFESGDFQEFNWTLSGDADWTIDTTEAYDGNNSAVSGDIDNNQESILSAQVNILTSGDMSFAIRTSADTGDALEFYVDDELYQAWSGENEWFVYTTEILSGLHTLEWKYSKDSSGSSGDDSVWLDAIVLPDWNYQLPPVNPQANGTVDGIELTWQAPTDFDDELTLEGYNIYRDDVQINTDLIEETDYYDTETTAGIEYEYYITAVYNVGESAPSNTVTEEMLVLDPPIDLTYTVIENDVTLEWNHPNGIVSTRRNRANKGSTREATLIGFNIYKNDEQIDSIDDPSIMTYTDTDLEPGTYEYYITAQFEEGESDPSNSVNVEIVTAGEDESSFTNNLLSCYPNPFNLKSKDTDATTIDFTLKNRNRVLLEIYNIRGKKVKTLANREFNRGNSSIIWKGENSEGKEVGSGVYFYRMETKNYQSIKKLLIVK